MSLDNIQLTSSLYQSLFKNYLVDVNQNKVDKKITEKSEINFLGSNEKKIIFIANDNKNKFLGDNQMKFLNDLLSACNLTMADIGFINFYKNHFSYLDLTVQLQPKKILLFGIAADEFQLPFTIPFFQIQNFQEQLYLISPSFDDLQKNKELKKQLWNSLQKIFNLNQ